jgi:hypothetical protein
MTHELIVTARKLAKTCADRLIGTGARRNNPAWRQVYRSLEHGFSRGACEQCKALGFPDEIVRFGNAFVRLQKERHDADYDPAIRFTKPEVALLIGRPTTRTKQPSQPWCC